MAILTLYIILLISEGPLNTQIYENWCYAMLSSFVFVLIIYLHVDSSLYSLASLL